MVGALLLLLGLTHSRGTWRRCRSPPRSSQRPSAAADVSAGRALAQATAEPVFFSKSSFYGAVVFVLALLFPSVLILALNMVDCQDLEVDSAGQPVAFLRGDPRFYCGSRTSNCKLS